MTARIFQAMPRPFQIAFREPAPALWHRHDADEGAAPDQLKVIFNAAFERLPVGEFAVSEPTPTAWFRVSDAQAAAPGRPLRDLFDNRDRIEIGGVSYAVVSCRPDGQSMCEVTLAL